MNRRLKATKDRIETLFEFWRAQLGLDWLTIGLVLVGADRARA